jgi:hypothetical protein
MTAAPTPVTAPLSPRAARLAASLDAWPRRTVTLPELWTLFAAADPASSSRPERRSQLADALAMLTEAGMLTPARSFDRSETPPLPVRVTLPAQPVTVTGRALARGVPWRPELAWAASAPLTVGQVGVLQTVNAWLRDRGRDDDVVPLRERSLEVFGAEKRLDGLLATSLFGPDRLSFELLRTFRAHPPLPTRRVGDGPVMLVVENADTFDTMTRTLTGIRTAVGVMAWGAGGGFEASVLSVADVPGITDVAYFGDVDADGLRIAASAAATAVATGLPLVRPAAGLYRLLMEVGVPQPGEDIVDAERAKQLALWLGESAAAATEFLMSGCRLAQEAVSARILREAHAEMWAADLR